MTSEARPRFPFVLTLAAAAVVAICSGLGVWQLQRLKWKEGVLAHIAVLQHAPPQPIGPVLERAARGEDVAYTRVAVDCAPSSLNDRPTYISGVADQTWAWDAVAACGLTGLPYDAIPVVRGVLVSGRGSTQPPTERLPGPERVTGVLRPAGRKLLFDSGRMARYVLYAESESPAPPGVVPSRIEASAPANLQYVGSYGPTWFGLAVVALCFYAAMLWRRRHPHP